MSNPLNDLGKLHRENVSAHFSVEQKRSIFSRYYRKLLAHRYNLVVSKEARVLEVGCGEGELLSLINAQCKVGIDLSPAQIKRGREKHPNLDLRIGAGETLFLDDQPFDVIIISDTLNDASDVELFLRQASRMLPLRDASHHQHLQYTLDTVPWHSRELLGLWHRDRYPAGSPAGM
jgi:2-polyprenyl-3-methyl-5-hydroxy-6-metoxy-1,4-benzoquinol methylase